MDSEELSSICKVFTISQMEAYISKYTGYNMSTIQEAILHVMIDSGDPYKIKAASQQMHRLILNMFLDIPAGKEKCKNCSHLSTFSVIHEKFWLFSSFKTSLFTLSTLVAEWLQCISPDHNIHPSGDLCCMSYPPPFLSAYLLTPCNKCHKTALHINSYRFLFLEPYRLTQLKLQDS